MKPALKKLLRPLLRLNPNRHVVRNDAVPLHLRKRPRPLPLHVLRRKKKLRRRKPFRVKRPLRRKKVRPLLLPQFKVRKPPHLPVVNLPKKRTRTNQKRPKLPPQRLLPFLPLPPQQTLQKPVPKFQRQKPKLELPPQLLKQLQQLR